MLLSDIQSYLLDCCNRSVFPGACVCVTNVDDEHFGQAGALASDQHTPVDSSTIYDLASLTKPIATTTAILILCEQNRINLDATIFNYLPEFSNESHISKITIKHLLTHTSGLAAWKPLYVFATNRKEMVEYILRQPLQCSPGFSVVYSCLGFIVLAEIVTRITGLSLGEFCKIHIFQPLKMNDTGFNPSRRSLNRIAPTELGNQYEKMLCEKSGYHYGNWRQDRIHGEVHDGNSFTANGQGGNAGLFSTAADLAKFARFLLNITSNTSHAILQRKTIESATSNHTSELDSHRGLGWQMAKTSRVAGGIFSSSAYGHNGFTGTSFWLDPIRKCAVIFLSNRMFFGGSGESFNSVRATLHSMVVHSVDKRYSKH